MHNAKREGKKKKTKKEVALRGDPSVANKRVIANIRKIIIFQWCMFFPLV